MNCHVILTRCFALWRSPWVRCCGSRTTLLCLSWSVALVALGGCIPSPTVAEQPKPLQRARDGSTALGRPLPLPAEFESSRIRNFVGYSPSGRYLALQSTNGSPGRETNDAAFIDLAAQTVISAFQDLIVDNERASLTAGQWLPGDRAVVYHAFMTADQAAAPRNSVGMPPEVESHIRVFDLNSRAQIQDVSLGTNSAIRSYVVLAGKTDQTWLVAAGGDPAARLAEYDPASDRETEFSMPVERNALLRYAIEGRWISKFVLPGHDADERVRWSDVGGRVASVVYSNIDSGQTVEIANLRVGATFEPRLLTVDGRYAVASERGADGAPSPFVIDTNTGTRFPLPPSERWVPVAASAERGVILVYWLIFDGGQPIEHWAEVPISAVLPA